MIIDEYFKANYAIFLNGTPLMYHKTHNITMKYKNG